jgi:hypothetical protein
MISGVPFYNSLFKKYVIIFGTLFNNIKVERKDSQGHLVQTFKVPIAYGPREKFLARLEDNPDAAALTAIKLPRMAFEISNIQYDPSRKLQSVNRVVSKKNLNGVNVYDKVHNPVPYNIGFRLDILSKTMEDGLRIVEQILPYFTPEWTVSAKLLGNDFDNVTDIPIILESVQYDDEYAADFLSRRILTFTLNFTMKCYFYGPVTESKIIKLITVALYPDTTANNGVVTTILRPGLTEDGLPTSNADLSVALSQIDEDDNYGFIVTIDERYGG